MSLNVSMCCALIASRNKEPAQYLFLMRYVVDRLYVINFGEESATGIMELIRQKKLRDGWALVGDGMICLLTLARAYKTF